jgi:hypothetical protein
VAVSDGHGGTDSATVQVVVNEAADTTAPAITDLTPAPGTTTTTRQPTIGATVKDERTAVAKEDLVLYVDGIQVTALTYDAATGRLAYTPPKRLATGEHSVRVLATDKAGNTATRAWTFTVLR